MVRRTSHLLVCRILYKSYCNAQTTALVLPSVSNDQVVLVIDHWRSRALHVHRGIKALPNIRSISEYKASLSLTLPSMVRDTYLVMFHTALFVPVDWTGCSKSWYRSRAASWFSDPWRHGDRGTRAEVHHDLKFTRSKTLLLRLLHVYIVQFQWFIIFSDDMRSLPNPLRRVRVGFLTCTARCMIMAFMARERVRFYVVLYW